MSALDVLNREYPGDVAWWAFVDVFRPAWDARPGKKAEIERFSDEEIAIVLTASLGDDAATWFNARNNALGGRSPSDVLKNQRFGHAIVRSLIMRMPLSPPSADKSSEQLARTGKVDESLFKGFSEAWGYDAASTIRWLERQLSVLLDLVRAGRPLYLYQPHGEPEAVITTEEDFRSWAEAYFPGVNVG